jgi:hypothetical protein
MIQYLNSPVNNSLLEIIKEYFEVEYGESLIKEISKTIDYYSRSEMTLNNFLYYVYRITIYLDIDKEFNTSVFTERFKRGYYLPEKYEFLTYDDFLPEIIFSESLSNNIHKYIIENKIISCAMYIVKFSEENKVDKYSERLFELPHQDVEYLKCYRNLIEKFNYTIYRNEQIYCVPILKILQTRSFINKDGNEKEVSDDFYHHIYNVYGHLEERLRDEEKKIEKSSVSQFIARNNSKDKEKEIQKEPINLDELYLFTEEKIISLPLLQLTEIAKDLNIQYKFEENFSEEEKGLYLSSLIFQKLHEGDEIEQKIPQEEPLVQRKDSTSERKSPLTSIETPLPVGEIDISRLISQKTKTKTPYSDEELVALADKYLNRKVTNIQKKRVEIRELLREKALEQQKNITIRRKSLEEDIVKQRQEEMKRKMEERKKMRETPPDEKEKLISQFDSKKCKIKRKGDKSELYSLEELQNIARVLLNYPEKDLILKSRNDLCKELLDFIGKYKQGKFGSKVSEEKKESLEELLRQRVIETEEKQLEEEEELEEELKEEEEEELEEELKEEEELEEELKEEEEEEKASRFSEEKSENQEGKCEECKSQIKDVIRTGKITENNGKMIGQMIEFCSIECMNKSELN